MVIELRERLPLPDEAYNTTNRI